MSVVAVVGVGTMGAAVCGRLAGAGHTVAAWDVRASRADAARARGARWAASARDAAARADVLLTVLPGPADVTAAVDDRVLGALRPGGTWIDLSTNTPAAAAPIRARALARGLRVLEAPMGGGPADAEHGTLRLFTGGDADVLDAQRPLLECLAPPERIVRAGGPGTGYTVKLLVNLLWFGQAVATAEALLVGQGAGVPPETLRGILADSAAASDFIRRDLPALLDGDYMASYGIDRIHDQLAATTALARDLGVPHQVSESVRRVHEETAARFGPVDGELLAVALLEEQAGTRLRR